MYLIIFYPLTLFLYVNPGLSLIDYLFIHYLVLFTLIFCRRGISRRVRRGAGGLVVYVREELARGIEFVHSKKMEDRAWLRLKKNMFNFTNDVYLGFFYIPP